MFNLFQNKIRCPNCGQTLETKPTKKQDCPHCGKSILVRGGELVTEEEAKIRDWLLRLEWFEIRRDDFNNYRSQLSKKFGTQAGVNDTIWSIFNHLIIKYGKNLNMLYRVYQEMASLV